VAVNGSEGGRYASGGKALRFGRGQRRCEHPRPIFFGDALRLGKFCGAPPSHILFKFKETQGLHCL
jgi:hypothetical protein